MALPSPTELVLHVTAHAGGSRVLPEQPQPTLILTSHPRRPSTAVRGRGGGANASVTSGVEQILHLRYEAFFSSRDFDDRGPLVWVSSVGVGGSPVWRTNDSSAATFALGHWVTLSK